MGGYLIEAVRIGGITLMVQYGVKCLGKIDQAKIIKMCGMSMAGISLLKGFNYMYKNPPEWVVNIRETGRAIGKTIDKTSEITNQIMNGDIKGLFGL